MNRERRDLGVADLTFDERGLIPVIVQQYDTLEVLMMAWMDTEAIERTMDSGRAWYWSRSRQAYWMKGESSGHVQEVKELRYDCDADALLLAVDQVGPACHTNERSCFYRTLYPVPGQGSGPDTANSDNIPLS
ncbi:MAG: phosphoribosyl-AMP cyclohydrolase [Coriobacteriia bacterium]